MVTTGEKFRQIRKALHLGQAKFAEPLGIGDKQISAIENGRVNPSPSVINLLLDRYPVSRTWWETGDGEIIDSYAALIMEDRKKNSEASEKDKKGQGLPQLAPEEQKRLDMMRELGIEELKELDAHLHRILAEKLMRELKRGDEAKK